jgi:group I intron endonuclease
MQVYKITNLLNNKIYVGKSKYNNPNYYGSGKLIKQAIKKYGLDNFKKDILQTCFSESELNEAEKKWIRDLNSRDRNIGYNIAHGGDGGKTLDHPWNYKLKNTIPEESISRIKTKNSEHMKELYSKGLIVNGMKGRVPWNKGLPMLDNVKEALLNANKGKKHSEEFKRNLSISMLGKNKYPRSEEHRRKISESLKGRKLSSETILKMSNTRKGKSSCAGPVVECPICGKLGTRNAMMRWHFDNCKYKDK